MDSTENIVFKYQLILIGSLNDYAKTIVDLFFERIADLKLPREAFEIIYESNFNDVYEGNQPAFVIYFGNRNGNFNNLNLLDILTKDGTMILPVFYNQNKFNNEIPEKIRNQNGLILSSESIEKIVSYSLEAFSLLRSSRKLFISYKRSESTSVAIQLYEELEKNNFDVFLDTHSIKKGEPFQDELWSRMTDCDVIVLLNTKGFLDSDWCKEEIAEANAKQIGIVQLVWPNHELDKPAEICYPIGLKETDFINNEFESETSRLKLDILKNISSTVESSRARNLASRQDSLITEFTNIARKQGKNMNLQPQRFITEETGINKKRIFIPTVGIPQSFDCNQSDDLRREITDYEVEDIFLIYDDLRIRDKWLKHLDWLNNYLEVKTIKKQEFKEWLKVN